MTTPTKEKKIHALIGVTKLPDGNFTPLLDSSLKGLLANANIYTKPPVDLTLYGNGITAYETSIPAALDGSKTAKAQKSKLRAAATKMYVELAHYVEANCGDDMATFLLSGFQAASTTKTPSQPIAQPTIASAAPAAITGQMKIKVSPVNKALSYTVRYAPVPSGGGTPVTWAEQILTSSKAVIIGNLTPGITYTFQVCALGCRGSTDWSDPVNRMAT
jgi:hypothetical protein